MSTIAWFEVAAAGGRRARNFYGDLFCWSFEPFAGSWRRP